MIAKRVDVDQQYTYGAAGA